MGCLIVLLFVLLSPRILGLVFLFFTNYWERAYATALWPILGWFFLPWTALTYMAAMLNNNHEVSGVWTVLILIAMLIDLAPYRAKYRINTE